MKKYPRISDVEKREKNTQAKCRCGEVAKFKVCVQEDYFRGNDILVWSCDIHKRDAEYLTDTPARQQAITNATLERNARLSY